MSKTVNSVQLPKNLVVASATLNLGHMIQRLLDRTTPHTFSVEWAEFNKSSVFCDRFPRNALLLILN